MKFFRTFPARSRHAPASCLATRPTTRTTASFAEKVYGRLRASGLINFFLIQPKDSLTRVFFLASAALASFFIPLSVRVHLPLRICSSVHESR